MHALLALLAATLATSQPTTRQTPSRSNGFHLTSRLARPSGDSIINGGTPDLSPSVEGLSFVAIHTGAGLSQAILYPAALPETRTYYLNGTAAQASAGTTNILSDGGTPPFPWGIGISPQAAVGGERLVTVNGGEGTPLSIGKGPEPFVLSGAGKGTFVACDRYVPYYRTNYTVVGYVEATTDEVTGRDKYEIPDACVLIQLRPVCAALPELPDGAWSSHAFVLDADCVVY